MSNDLNRFTQSLEKRPSEKDNARYFGLAQSSPLRLSVFIPPLLDTSGMGSHKGIGR